LRVCSGVGGFGREDPVICATDFLGNNARSTAGGTGFDASLWVLDNVELLARCGGVFFVRVDTSGASHVSLGRKQTPKQPYLCFLTLRGLGLAVAAFFLPEAEIAVKVRDPFVGLRYFRGEPSSCARRAALCFSSSSPMFALRRAMGIRLTRRSRRARRS
jgi:hypothetical protein